MIDHDKLVARVQHFYEHLQNCYHYESEEALKKVNCVDLSDSKDSIVSVIEKFVEEFEDIFSDCIYFE